MIFPKRIGVYWKTESFIGFKDRRRTESVKRRRGVYYAKAVTFASGSPDVFEFFEYQGHHEINQFYLASADLNYYLEKGDLYSIADMDSERLLYGNPDSSPR